MHERKPSYAELDRLRKIPLDNPLENEKNSFTSYARDALLSCQGSKVIRGDYLDLLIEKKKGNSGRK